MRGREVDGRRADGGAAPIEQHGASIGSPEDVVEMGDVDPRRRSRS
jgi:hypothetical protein